VKDMTGSLCDRPVGMMTAVRESWASKTQRAKRERLPLAGVGSMSRS
jgi:hypothetical protein